MLAFGERVTRTVKQPLFSVPIMAFLELLERRLGIVMIRPFPIDSVDGSMTQHVRDLIDQGDILNFSSIEQLSDEPRLYGWKLNSHAGQSHFGFSFQSENAALKQAFERFYAEKGSIRGPGVEKESDDAQYTFAVGHDASDAKQNVLLKGIAGESFARALKDRTIRITKFHPSRVDADVERILDACNRYRIALHFLTIDSPTPVMCVVADDLTMSEPKYTISLGAGSHNRLLLQQLIADALGIRRCIRQDKKDPTLSISKNGAANEKIRKFIAAGSPENTESHILKAKPGFDMNAIESWFEKNGMEISISDREIKSYGLPPKHLACMKILRTRNIPDNLPLIFTHL